MVEVAVGVGDEVGGDDEQDETNGYHGEQDVTVHTRHEEEAEEDHPGWCQHEAEGEAFVYRGGHVAVTAGAGVLLSCTHHGNTLGLANP